MNEFQIENRMKRDSAAEIADAEIVLDELRVLRVDRMFSKILGNAFSETLKNKERTVREHLSETFKIIVVGDFKRGKSTLINALLGADVVPTAVTPETLTINHISYGETLRAEMILQDNKRVALEQEELTRDALTGILSQLPSPVRYLDIRSNAEMLKEVTIIDTPGLGELDNTFDAQISDYLVHADAILYVISANVPFSSAEQAFLSTYVLPQNFSRIFLVVNMADFLETEENIEKIRARMLERVSVIGNPCSVFMISALNEYCRKMNRKRPSPALAEVLDQSFYAFETALRDDVLLQKDLIRSARVAALTEDLLNDVLNHVRLLKSTLESGAQKRSQAKDDFQAQEQTRRKDLEKHKEEVAATIRDMRAEASVWMTELLSRIREELTAAQTSTAGNDLERYLQFYLTDMVRDALALCVERHQADIVDLLASTAKVIANEIYAEHFGVVNTQIALSMADISWTKVDSALFASEVILNLTSLSSFIGPLYLVAQTIGGFVRQNIVKKQQREHITPILAEFDSLTSEVVRSVDEVYKGMIRNAAQSLDGVYEKQRDAASEAFDQAQQIMQGEEGLAEQAMEYFETVATSIATWKETLGQYR